MEILDKFALLKKKCIRANHSKFVTKELGNQFPKIKTRVSKMKYNKQRNLCVIITRKAKRSYYVNLDLKYITDSNKFWVTEKPLFSNKIKSTEYITLVGLIINTNHSFLINKENENDPIEKVKVSGTIRSMTFLKKIFR